MTEAPFLPRERLFKQQNYFQNLTKHTYLKGRYDVITSVAIPLALAASSMFMIVRPWSLQHVSRDWEKGVNFSVLTSVSNWAWK
ncbi:hypothetical protein PVAP13_2NG643401 [Panicum virgatum]|uniref:Uncharacterized protein n=1 Tax=Panicum virgatum TaxID=38727 RepID=A0A8T0VYJ8_PANVG|nr:hypothetical protein PVAP13_2NG643401 [Panicum virgatum]